MKKKVVITGSCGFIFSNFIRYALREKTNYDFVSIDKVVRPEGLQNIYANKGHKFWMGDVADRHFVNTVFTLEKPDIVVHAAAESFVDDSISNANPFIISNVLGTQVIADLCIEHKVDRLVYISTDEVMGQLTSENDEPWDEEASMAPRNPYSASKACGELIVKAAHETHGLEYNITRCCNNFGPRQSPRNLIPKVIKNILNKEPIPIFGDGSQIREWIYVLDNCRAVMQILDSAPPNETYNISTNYEISNLELVHKICNIMESGHSLIEFVEDRKGHDFRYSITNDKIKELGWKPSFKLVDGLKLCTKWYIKNQWYLR